MEPFLARRRRLLEAIDGAAIFFAAPWALRTNDVRHEYRQDSDLFYLTGFREPEAVLVLAPKHADHKQILFVRPRDPENAVWDGPRAGVEGAVERFGADIAHPIGELAARLPEYLRGHQRLYHALGKSRSADDRVIEAIARVRGKGRSASIWPTEIVDPAVVLHEMRARKSNDELFRMRRAAEITRDAHLAAMAAAAPGRHEYEVEAEIRRVCRQRGAERLAYPPIVGSGPNALVLHYRDNNRKIEDGELVLIDAAAEHDYYACDVTRTFPANGAFSPAQRELYEVVLEAEQAAIEAIKPGATIDGIHAIAVRQVVAGLVRLGLLEGEVDALVESRAYRKLYMHRTSHYLGMDVHDVGLYYGANGKPRPLEEGMVLTVEPGIYVAADDASAPARFRGLGVRIEDDVVVTAEGFRELTSDIPREAAEVERACRA
ncbi:MAG: aminopeptidase P N-terminal domain-containing protein [Byssovorax sp.]